MMNDIKSGNVNGIIVKNLEQLIRDDFIVTKMFLEQIKENGAKVIIAQDSKMRDILTTHQILEEKIK